MSATAKNAAFDKTLLPRYAATAEKKSPNLTDVYQGFPKTICEYFCRVKGNCDAEIGISERTFDKNQSIILVREPGVW